MVLSRRRGKGIYYSISRIIKWIYTWGSEAIRSLIHYNSLQVMEVLKSRKKVFDPQGPFLQRWNKIFVLSCVMALAVDFMFFYIPVVNANDNCIDMDHKLEIATSIFRSFTDIFYILHIIFQFKTGFLARSSRVYGKGVLVEDSSAIAKRYLSSYFLVDILAVLPLPQLAVLVLIPKLKGSASFDAKTPLMFIMIAQCLPRLARIIPLYLDITRTAGIIVETAWAGAAFNLFLYMLASHVVGAFWYLLSIGREAACWRHVCHINNCTITSWYCGGVETESKGLNTTDCSITTDGTGFDFGIFKQALQYKVVQSWNIWEKSFYCFWWGLQNLSSLGQGLQTTIFFWEILFAISISISSLVLLALLIGNMQAYLQSTTIRIEEMRVRRQDAEQWMSYRLLPENLKERIRRHEQYRWQETRGFDEEQLLQNLPKDLRRDIKRHLCLALLKRVPLFKKMDDRLMDAMCDRLKPMLYTESSCIICEGDPVDEMLFIMRGELLSFTTNGGRTGFFNSDYLKAGDFCGEELLTWALDPRCSSNLPSSTRTVKAVSEVEAFALVADDLRFVASQFRRLHTKQLRHTFRFYSQHWRTWAACFIQAAWRRYVRKKLEDSLEENSLQEALKNDCAGLPSLGATIYASRFAVNALRSLRRNGTRKSRLQERLPAILLQKPSEPDFTSEEQ
ncbi:cyclic nucleotide-gated ion channel 1-like isoform X1 [Typha latifolia]|uniref:cyclic nucleotide-gated ion channel 1-like isoform X1 n=1 Tax=Typha latifolia TaxID=4733 RepID=UPI003C2BE355